MKKSLLCLTILLSFNINAETLFRMNLNNIKIIDNTSELPDNEIEQPTHDENGFDEFGIHKDTNTYYDPQGLDKDRIDYNVQCNERSAQNSFNYSRYADCGNTAQYTSFIYFNGNYIGGAGYRLTDQLTYWNNRIESPVEINGYKYFKNGSGTSTGSVNYNSCQHYYFHYNHQYGVCRQKIDTRYNPDGFDSRGIHKDTGTFFDSSGYDINRKNNLGQNEIICKYLQNADSFTFVRQYVGGSQYYISVLFNGKSVYYGGINSTLFNSRTPTFVIVDNYKYSYKTYKILFDEDLGYPYYRKNYLYEVCRELNN